MTDRAGADFSPRRFKLGDRVVFTGVVAKTHDENRTLYEEVPGTPPGTEGIIFGRRTVTPGKIEAMTEFDGYWNHIPVGNQFIPTPGASRRVWLVAFDLRCKPVMCFDEQVQEVEDA